MPYIGNTAGNRFVASKAASVYSGDGSTTAFTLEHAVGSDEDILVSVDGVIQEPSVAYAVSSGTTLTFTAAPSSNSGNNIFVYYLFRTVATVDHPSTSALSATSGTFSGDVAVDTDTLFVDSTNDRVGINAASPGESFVVHGTGSTTVTRLKAPTSTQVYQRFDNTTSNTGYVGYNGTSLEFWANNNLGLAIDGTGAVTKPDQPAFSCLLGAGNQSSLSVSTTHTVLFTEIFDQNGDFASNTFTAPVTGRYQLQTNLYINSMDEDTSYYQIRLETSNRTYYAIIDPGAFDSDPGQCSLQISVLADMDANDTAIVKLQLGSGGATQSSIYNNSNFSGYLVA